MNALLGVLLPVLATAASLNTRQAFTSPSQRGIYVEGYSIERNINISDHLTHLFSKRDIAQSPDSILVPGYVTGTYPVYMVNLTIGSTEWPVVFDTGSDYTWVTKFQPISGDYEKTDQRFEMAYMSQPEGVSGPVWRGLVELGDCAVPDMYFGSSPEKVDMGDSASVGILGMGPQTSMATTDRFGVKHDHETFFELAYPALPENLFSVGLNKDGSADFLLGGIPEDIKSQLKWTRSAGQVNGLASWALKIPAVRASNMSRPFGDIRAIVDTGSSHLYVPSWLDRSYWGNVPYATKHKWTWEYPCDFILPDLVMHIADGMDVVVRGEVRSRFLYVTHDRLTDTDTGPQRPQKRNHNHEQWYQPAHVLGSGCLYRQSR